METYDLIRHMLEELEHPYRPLSSWEEGFVASIMEYFEEHDELTENQLDKLVQIYEEKTRIDFERRKT